MIKIPGLDTELRVHHLLLIFPWVLAVLYSARVGAVLQINAATVRAGRAGESAFAEARDAAEQSASFYRPLARWDRCTMIAILAAMELVGIGAAPALSYVDPVSGYFALNDKLVFWVGVGASIVAAIAYWSVLLTTRRTLAQAQES
jgi:hypothetical protein